MGIAPAVSYSAAPATYQTYQSPMLAAEPAQFVAQAPAYNLPSAPSYMAPVAQAPVQMAAPMTTMAAPVTTMAQPFAPVAPMAAPLTSMVGMPQNTGVAMPMQGQYMQGGMA